MRRRSRKYLFCVAIFLFISFYVTSSFLFAYIRDILCISDVFKFLAQYLENDDVSCYWQNVNNSAMENVTSNSIFFHHTECDYLSLRDACTVEAVATLHPGKIVYVLFLPPIPKYSIVVQELLKIPNVKVSRLNINTYTKSTPLHDFFRKDINGKISYKNVADLLKFVTLFKFGGIVVDFDVIVAKSLDDLGENWLVKDDNDLSTAIMKLSNNVLGRAAAGMVLSNLKKQGVHINGDKAISAAFEEICASSNVENISSLNCNGYQVYSDKLFFPISYYNRYLFFKHGDIDEEAMSFRIWDNDYRNYIPRDALYARLAKSFCPKIFNSFTFEFTKLY